MRTSKNQPLGILATLAIGFLLFATAASAQNNVLAIGQVSSAGTLIASADTLGGGAVSSVKNAGTGNYTVTLTSAGAFTGAAATEFLVELTIEGNSSSDRNAKASIISVNANQLLVRVRTDDVEEAPPTNAAVATNASFFFSIYRVPTAFPATGSTKFLRAVGQVDDDGSLISGVGIDGIAVTSSKAAGNGSYNVILSKTGAFAGASVDDFVVILNVRAAGDQDRGIRGDVFSLGDDVMIVRVRVDELQDLGNDDLPVPIDDEFYFTIYRIPPGAGAGLADSNLLVAMGSVDGSDTGVDPLVSGGAFDGGTVSKNRVGTGNYDITITSPGAFAGKTTADYSLQLCLNQSVSADEAITGFLSAPTDDTLVINVYTNDVDETVETEGVPTDVDFYFFLYDAQESFQPDLRIGRKKNLTQQVGNDVYNAGGAGQQQSIGLPGTNKKKYWFTLENDGNVSDDIFLKVKRSGSKITSKYFRITGGRQNVTAAITSGAFVVDDVPPGKLIRYEAQAKYKKPGKRPSKTLRFLARSEFLGSRLDANKAKLVPK